MSKKLFLALLLAVAGAASANASDRLPSNSKLAKLGLSSMNVVDDTAGMKVRGQGVGILGARFFVLAQTVLIDNKAGFVAGPASPAFGSVGTVNGGVNTPFTGTFTQNINGSQFTVVGSVWGTVNGFAN